MSEPRGVPVLRSVLGHRGARSLNVGSADESRRRARGARGMSDPVVSILIVNWNTGDRIMQCLASLPNDIAGRSLTILVPSKKVKTEYDALFGNAKMEILPFKIAVDTQHMAPRPADHYSSVRLLMSGRPMERKVTWWLSARASTLNSTAHAS